MGTFHLLARKAGRLILLIFVVVTLVFFVPYIIPEGPARGVRNSDAPAFVRYGQWMLGVLRFDLGRSPLSGEKVSTLILRSFPLTLGLSLLGMGVACLIALPLGILSALRRRSLWDYAGIIFSWTVMALPGFLLGLLLLLVFAALLEIFPFFGDDAPLHFVLPVLALGLGHAAVLLRVVRASMIEELGRQYITMAVSKGLPDKMTRCRHALRNALLPVIGSLGMQFGSLLGGSLIVEQVFSLSGLGRLVLSAVHQRDFPVIQGCLIFFALMFCCLDFLAGILYAHIGPRTRVR
ncbi:MAG: ABC transporter permease [Spirochaetales bacterium]|jgi:peptide/nickel transport system permease protein|nr:ABC transporter permease [Spirochaetales bacterium]